MGFASVAARAGWQAFDDTLRSVVTAAFSAMAFLSFLFLTIPFPDGPEELYLIGPFATPHSISM